MGLARDIRRAVGHGITKGQIKLSRALGNILNRLDVEKVGPSWAVDTPNNDLHPTSGDDSGIGTAINPVGHVAIGHRSSASVDGGMVARSLIAGGGVSILGLRDYDPGAPTGPELRGNAPVEVDGIAVFIGGGNLLLEMDQPISEDHELLLGTSQQLEDGRYFSPLLLGPRKVYESQQFVENPSDINVLDIGSVQVLSMVLIDDYPAHVSNYSFEVYLENLGRRDTDFTVRVLVDSVVKATYPVRLNGNALLITDGGPVLENGLIGQEVSVTVEAISTHPQSQGWVRGSIQRSIFYIKK